MCTTQLRSWAERVFVLFAILIYPRAANGECGIAAVAQLVERVLGKDEVMGPSPISS